MRVLCLALTALASGASLALTGCASAPPTPHVEPVRPPPILCAPIPPEPEPAGALVRPITAEEIAGFDRFLDAELSARLWGRGLAVRAKTAKDTYCR